MIILYIQVKRTLSKLGRASALAARLGTSNTKVNQVQTSPKMQLARMQSHRKSNNKVRHLFCLHSIIQFFFINQSRHPDVFKTKSSINLRLPPSTQRCSSAT